MEYFNRLLIENAALKADKIMYRDYAHNLAQKLRALRGESAKNQREQAELLKLRAENRKLKASLRKLYEKYIKPTQDLSKFDYPICMHCAQKILSKGDLAENVPAWVSGSSPNEKGYVTTSSELVGMSYRASDGSWHTIKALPEIYTDVLFIDYENGHAYRDPSYALVKFHGKVTQEDLKREEDKQIGASRTGGSYLRIIDTLGLDYTLISEGKLSRHKYDKNHLVYKLTVGNY